jgi:hypothetical protein
MSEQQTRKTDFVDEGWLNEFHRYLWDQPQQKREIFLTAYLTPDHYIKLQAKLDAQFPNRHSDSYYAQSDVTAIKLDILRSTLLSGAPPTEHRVCPSMTADSTTVSMTGVEGQEDETSKGNEIEDDLNPELEDISRFLPTSTRYVDLSTIPFSSLPERCPFPLLIRKDYDIMADLLDTGLPGQRGSVFLTGQPGIGTRVGLPMHSF